MKTKEIINIVTRDENICPVCGASIKPEYSNWNDCYEYYNWDCVHDHLFCMFVTLLSI